MSLYTFSRFQYLCWSSTHNTQTWISDQHQLFDRKKLPKWSYETHACHTWIHSKILYQSCAKICCTCNILICMHYSNWCGYTGVRKIILLSYFDYELQHLQQLVIWLQYPKKYIELQYPHTSTIYCFFRNLFKKYIVVSNSVQQYIVHFQQCNVVSPAVKQYYATLWCARPYFVIRNRK
jgi:hypothetical protein